MKVILLRDISGVGKKYDLKDIADGHALNYLIPRKLAEPASAGRTRQIEALQAKEAEARTLEEAALAEKLNSLSGVSVECFVKANEQGHLFKGVKPAEILGALKEQTGIQLAPEHIELAHPIKEVGEHTVAVSVGSKQSSFTFIVKAA